MPSATGTPREGDRLLRTGTPLAPIELSDLPRGGGGGSGSGSDSGSDCVSGAGGGGAPGGGGTLAWRAVVLGSRMNILAPLAIAAWIFRGAVPDALTFAMALLSLAPLAERIGFVTEELAEMTSTAVGGLLNASFGNVTELIVSLVALQRGAVWLVQSSLLGSILSNLLLVLGCALAVGGWRHRLQGYNRLAANVNAQALLLSSLALIIPSVARATDVSSKRGVLAQSRFASLVLLGVYVMYLVFQLKTHSEVFDEEDDEDDEDDDDGVAGNALGARNTVAADAGDRDVRISVADGADQHREHRHHTRHAGVAALGVGGLGLVGVSAAPGSDDGGESDPVEALDHDGEPGAGGGGGGGVQVVEENAAPLLSVKAACFWLGVITILISMASDVLVDTLEEAASQYNIPAFAVATIFVPIVGNAAEHWAAVTFASRDKMGLSMAIAVGSSTQVSLFLIPFCVVAGWIMGTEMSLDFHQLQVACVAVAVLLVAQISSHGESTWLSGVLLIATYLVMCAAFWFHCKPDETGGACHVAAAS